MSYNNIGTSMRPTSDYIILRGSYHILAVVHRKPSNKLGWISAGPGAVIRKTEQRSRPNNGGRSRVVCCGAKTRNCSKRVYAGRPCARRARRYATRGGGGTCPFHKEPLSGEYLLKSTMRILPRARVHPVGGRYV